MGGAWPAWIFAGGLIVALGWVAARREALVRVLFATVDPRPMAVFRIGFGASLLALVWETMPLSEYLFSDEGLLPRAAVAEVRGATGLVEPDGLRGALRYLGDARWSPLHLYDPPWFARAHLVALGLAAAAMTLGFRTRTATVVAWLLLVALLRRGDAHWGGEQVFTGFLFVSMFADGGAAYGIDARRRRAAELRRIPAWPQALLVLQLAVAYAANGWSKTGPTWISGDTLGLAVQLDRYARIDWRWLLALVGPWPLRLATWAVLWWERLFPIVLVGLWWRACAALRVPSLGSRVLRSRAAWLVDPRPWLGFGLLFHGIAMVLFEFGAFVGATVSAYALCGLAAPWTTTRLDPAPPAEGPSMPAWAWSTAVATIGAVGLVSIATGVVAWWYVGWAVVAIGSFVVGRPTLRPRRLAAALLVAHHACALLLWQSPISPWRDGARAMVEPWMERTYTRQLWSMFAPNGPTRDQTVRTTVVVGDMRHDLRTELEHDLRRPYLLHDRWRKIDEGISGYRRGLAPWHARWVCRRWMLDHGGEVPDRVVLERVVAPFAPLDAPDRGAWFWAHATIEPLVEVACAEDPFGVPDAEVLARHGIAAAPPQPADAP